MYNKNSLHFRHLLFDFIEQKLYFRNMTPTFSIIIPCYNQADFLDETLASVFRQTLRDWECLIIDDGSEDNTSQIAEQWNKKDHRFKLFQKENGGLSSARNYGLMKANGKYIQFLDSDDILISSKLECCHEQHRKRADIVVTSFQHITSGKITSPFCTLQKEYLSFENILLKWDAEFSIPIHCGSFSKDLIGSTVFDEKLNAGEDWIFWLDIFKKKPAASFINDSLVLYRLHNTSLTKNVPLMIDNKNRAQILIYDSLDESYKKRFFERFSKEAISRREELFNIYRQIEKRKKNKIKVFFQKMYKRVQD